MLDKANTKQTTATRSDNFIQPHNYYPTQAKLQISITWLTEPILN
ncbi:hypothetical protein ALT1644_150016 [Alteromonas macleodii]